VITDHLSCQASRSHHADGVEFHIRRIELVAAILCERPAS
jgi:hypothetical protein